MNVLNRTLLASLVLCTVAFAQNAVADDQVKPDSPIKSVPQPAVITKPVNTTVPPGYGNATPTTKNPKVGATPTAKGKVCLPPCQ